MNMNQGHDDHYGDVNSDWAAYRRMKRQERNQRWSVVIVTVAFFGLFALIAAAKLGFID